MYVYEWVWVGGLEDFVCVLGDERVVDDCVGADMMIISHSVRGVVCVGRCSVAGGCVDSVPG